MGAGDGSGAAHADAPASIAMRMISGNRCRIVIVQSALQTRRLPHYSSTEYRYGLHTSRFNAADDRKNVCPGVSVAQTIPPVSSRIRRLPPAAPLRTIYTLPVLNVVPCDTPGLNAWIIICWARMVYSLAPLVPGVGEVDWFHAVGIYHFHQSHWHAGRDDANKPYRPVRALWVDLDGVSHWWMWKAPFAGSVVSTE